MISLASLLERVGLYAGRLPRPFTLEAHLARELLPRVRPALILDVGAHEGEYGQMLRALGYAGPIVSYEPHARSAHILGIRARRAGDWHVRQVALSDTRGHATLHVTAGSDLASLHEPSARGHARYPGAMVIAERETVPVTTLAEEWSTLDPRGPVLLKLDTQGHDLAVLRGAAPVLSQITAIQTELSSRALYDGIPSLSDSLRWFDDNGFAMSGIFPRSRYHRGLTILELDATFVRDAAAE